MIMRYTNLLFTYLLEGPAFSGPAFSGPTFSAPPFLEVFVTVVALNQVVFKNHFFNILRASARHVSKWIQVCVRNVSYAYSDVFCFSVGISSSLGNLAHTGLQIGNCL